MFSLNFLIYTIGGIWRPVEYVSCSAKFLYNVFTLCTLFLIYFLLLTEFLDIVLVIDNVDDFIINCQMFVSMIAVCCKATVVVMRRDAIISSVQMLLEEPYKPLDEDEIEIQMKFNDFIRSCSSKYLLLALSSLMSVTLRSVLCIINGELPYRAWVPYDADVTMLFLFTSIQQILAVIFATLVNVGTETIVFGFLLQICAQLEIFENRLRKSIITRATGYAEFSTTLCNKKETLSENIRHHLGIYEYAKTINTIFNEVLFVQFFGSILVLCANVYYITMHITESSAATLITYTLCMFVQIFVYCWSGNEVILKSLTLGNAIYNMDWHLLSVKEKKDLLMIIKRSTIPIKFTSSFLITLSLDSFSSILKMSYTAFNVLTQ